MKIKNIFTLAHTIALEKGWWPEGERDVIGDPDRYILGRKIALIHSEASEALEELRVTGCDLAIKRSEAGKPCGFLTELADIVIRLGDLHCGLGFTSFSPDPNRAWLGRKMKDTPSLDQLAAVIAEVHHEIANMYLALRMGPITLCPPTATLAAQIADFVGRLGLVIAFDDVIHLKMEYNRKRPYRHGGKLL